MAAEQAIQISVEANEVVFAQRRLQVRATVGLDAETAKGALGLAGLRATVKFSNGKDSDARPRRRAAGRPADADRRRARVGEGRAPLRARRGAVLRQRLARQGRLDPARGEHRPPPGRPAGHGARLRGRAAGGQLHRDHEGRRPAHRQARGARVRPARRAGSTPTRSSRRSRRAAGRVRQAAPDPEARRRRAGAGRARSRSRSGCALPDEERCRRSARKGRRPTPRRPRREHARRIAETAERVARGPARARRRGAAARSARAGRLRRAPAERIRRLDEASTTSLRVFLHDSEGERRPVELDEDRPVRHRPVEPRPHRHRRQRRGLRRRARRHDQPLDHGAVPNQPGDGRPRPAHPRDRQEHRGQQAARPRVRLQPPLGQQHGPRRDPLGGADARLHRDQPELPSRRRADRLGPLLRRHVQGLARPALAVPDDRAGGRQRHEHRVRQPQGLQQPHRRQPRRHGRRAGRATRCSATRPRPTATASCRRSRRTARP